MSRPAMQHPMIDAHMHQWDPFSCPREVSANAKLVRWLPRIPRWLTWTQPRRDREFIGDAHHVLKPYLPVDYRRDASTLPIASVVHVETSNWAAEHPMDWVDETRWVAALPWGRDGAPELAAQVVHADPRWPEARTVLDAHLEADERVRGVRLSTAHHPNPNVRSFAEPHTLRAPAFLRGFAAIAERGLSFEIWPYSHELPDAVSLAAEYPDTTFVLNHYGTPVGIFGPRGRNTGRTAADRAEHFTRWRNDIAALAALPNVMAKHSGLGMPVLGALPKRPRTETTELVDRCAPLIRHVHDCFGAHRTMWASNFPIDKVVHSMPTSLAVVLEVLGADADTTLLTHDVARRVYRL